MAGYNSSWDYRVKVTVDKDQIDSDLSNVAVFVALSDLPADFHTNVNGDGSDIRVTKSDGETEVAREVVVYDDTGDTGELHFLAEGTNSISSSTDTDFYIYYGNSGASDYAIDATYGAENVWGRCAIVLHLEGDAVDSTTNDNDFSSSGTPDYSSTYGALGGQGAYWDSTSGTDYIYLPNASKTGVDFSADYTVLTLFQDKDYDGNYNGLFATDDTGGDRAHITFKNNNDDDQRWRVPDTGGFSQITGAARQTNDTWRFFAGRAETSKAYACWLDATKDSGTASNNLADTSNGILLGANWWTANESTVYSGKIDVYQDEFRLYSEAVSDDEIKAIRINLLTPNTFYTVGSQENNPNAGGDIKKLAGVAQASIKKVAGIAEASIKKVSGVSN